MKRVLGHLAWSVIFIILIGFFFRGQNNWSEALGKTGNADLLGLFWGGALMILAGMVWEAPDFYPAFRNRGIGFNGKLLLGQGIPAFVLFSNQLWTKAAGDWGVPSYFYTWAMPAGPELALIGALWGGMVLLRSFKNEEKMFHVKHRRR